MPAYSIQDIKINSGVSEENGTFKAFLDGFLKGLRSDN